MKCKGKLIIIGGAEDKCESANTNGHDGAGILQRLIEESAHKQKSRIEVLTTASSVPEEMGSDYVMAFRLLNAVNVGVLNIGSREDAFSPENLRRLNKADVVFATGGDQLRLTTIIGGSLFYDRLAERLAKEKDFIYAGTSAGAVAASETMISDGSGKNAALKGEIQTATGFGFMENIVFDTHFIARGRIGRLFEIVVKNPKILGVGIEENTGLLITKNKMEAIGSGMTILLDGRHITNHNLLEIKEGAPMSFENLTLHVMSRTDVFDLTEHTLQIKTPSDCQI